MLICPVCNERRATAEALYGHIREDHADLDFDPAETYDMVGDAIAEEAEANGKNMLAEKASTKRRRFVKTRRAIGEVADFHTLIGEHEYGLAGAVYTTHKHKSATQALDQHYIRGELEKERLAKRKRRARAKHKASKGRKP